MTVTITTNSAGETVVEGAEKDWLRFIRLSAENGAVNIWAVIKNRESKSGDDAHEALQYLTPLEAMKLSKAFERLAIQATGRDAADVAITTTFGQSWLKSFEVVSYEVEDSGIRNADDSRSGLEQETHLAAM